MRRSDREVTNIKDIEDILKNAFVCHLGLVDGDQPYVVPMNYAYFEGKVYLHSAKEGRKLDLIRKNKKVCFQMEITSKDIAKHGDQPCDWGTIYQSVIGTGIATLVSDVKEKERALKSIVSNFDHRDLPFHEGDFADTTVIRIDIKEMTGKRGDD